MSYRTLAALLLVAAPLGCDQNRSYTCFAAGTRIATPAGEVTIEALQVGDAVLAFDEASGAVVPSTVTAVFRHEDSRLGLLTLDDGQALRVTAEHPIYCPTSRSYRPAGELQAGGALLRLSQSQPADAPRQDVQLSQTTLRQPLAPLPDPQTVYNISVATYENYFADGLLVHNKTPVPIGGITLPDCLEGQLIAVAADRTMSCTQALTAGFAPPDCNSVPNSALNTYDGILECMPKGSGGTNAGLKTLINKAKTDTDNIENTINQFSSGGAAAKFCGQYSAAQNQNGAITGNNGVTGVAGAADLCQTVQGCGTGAHMCTVYEMYEIAASNGLPATVSQSWVHMQSWSHNSASQIPTANGLADNCSGWTYPTGDKGWYGTTVEWKNALTGQKALHFASGPGVVPCSARFPIACCR
jgi:hypothetical protein